MSLEQQLRCSFDEARRLFDDEPVPEFSQPSRRGLTPTILVVVVAVSAIGMLFLFGGFNAGRDLVRVPAATTAVNTGATPPMASVAVAVPEGFSPSVLAVDTVHGEFFLLDVGSSESIRVTTEDLGVFGSDITATLLGEILVFSESSDSKVYAYIGGLSEAPTVLQSGFAGSAVTPQWMVPDTEPSALWFVEGRPPWRVELVSAIDGSVILQASIALQADYGSQPVGATADGLVLKVLRYEASGEGLTPMPDSEAAVLVDRAGATHELGQGSVLTVGPKSVLIHECVSSECSLLEVRTDTLTRYEVSAQRWVAPTASPDTGEWSDQWSAIDSAGTRLLVDLGESGIGVLSLVDGSVITVVDTGQHSLAAWTADGSIIVITDGIVSAIKADGLRSEISRIPDGFYVVDVGR